MPTWVEIRPKYRANAPEETYEFERWPPIPTPDRTTGGKLVATVLPLLDEGAALFFARNTRQGRFAALRIHAGRVRIVFQPAEKSAEVYVRELPFGDLVIFLRRNEGLRFPEALFHLLNRGCGARRYRVMRTEASFDDLLGFAAQR